MKRIVLCLVLCWVSVGSAMAQALPAPAVSGMSEAVGGILQYVSQARGFAANDPRIYQTLYSVGTAAAETAGVAGAGLLIAGTSPAWGTVLGSAALIGAAGAAVSIGADALVKWAFSSGSSTPITVTAPGTSGTPVSGLMVMPSTTNPPMSTLVPASINTDLIVVTQAPPTYYSVHWNSTTVYTNPNPSLYIAHQNYTYNGTYYYVWNSATTTSSTGPCPTGDTLSGSQCVGAATGTTTTANQTLDQAIKSLTTAQNAEAINSQTMATMLNYLWQQAAAQPGYSGLPYQVSNPIQSSDVSSWEAANPAATPQVSWLGTPVPTGDFAPSTSTTTYIPASTATTPGTVNPAQGASEVNLGADPATPAPTLEDTPTAQMIVQPLLNLMPDLKAFTMPAHSGVCPQPSFSMFGQSYTFTEQCTLAEQYRSVLYAACVVMFTMAALFIVLTA